MPSCDPPAIPSPIESNEMDLLCTTIQSMHDARLSGDIDARIDVAPLTGKALRAAELLNATMDWDGAVLRETLDVAASWAIGDFHACLRPLRGKASVANEKLGLLHASLRALLSLVEVSVRRIVPPLPLVSLPEA